MTIPIIFKKNYIVELADTLSGHYYGVWLRKDRPEKTEVIKGNLVLVTPATNKGKFVGYFPSATTILNAYPTSEHLVKWIADNGFHESRAMRDEAGRKGTKIHTAIELLLDGGEIIKESYTIEEWHKLDTFVKWHQDYKPEVIAFEVPVFSKKGGYAGRVDCIAKIAGELYVVDWKSSANIHKSFPLQFAAYANAIQENTDLVINNVAAVQLGAKNKNGYRFVVYPNWKELHYPAFQAVQKTWLYDQYDSLKNPKDLPILKLPFTLKLDTINHEQQEKTTKTKKARDTLTKGEEQKLRRRVMREQRSNEKSKRNKV